MAHVIATNDGVINAQVRARVAIEARLLNGRLWDNGLGFEVDGWDFCLLSGAEWGAKHAGQGVFGIGASPTRARDGATR